MTSFLELLPGYKKSTLTFLLCSVMPHGLVHESEEKLRAHFLHGDPLSDWTSVWVIQSAEYFDRATLGEVTLFNHRRRLYTYIST